MERLNPTRSVAGHVSVFLTKPASRNNRRRIILGLLLAVLAGCAGSAIALSKMDASQIKNTTNVDLCSAHLMISTRNADLPISNIDTEIQRRSLDCTPIYAQYGIVTPAAARMPLTSGSSSRISVASPQRAQNANFSIVLVCDGRENQFDLSVDPVGRVVFSKDKNLLIRDGDDSIDNDGHRHVYFVNINPEHIYFGKHETWGQGANQTDTADLDRRTGRLNWSTTRAMTILSSIFYIEEASCTPGVLKPRF
jgi:hypothetical protein